jgi:hypothetical protein
MKKSIDEKNCVFVEWPGGKYYDNQAPKAQEIKRTVPLLFYALLMITNRYGRASMDTEKRKIEKHFSAYLKQLATIECSRLLFMEPAKQVDVQSGPGTHISINKASSVNMLTLKESRGEEIDKFIVIDRNSEVVNAASQLVQMKDPMKKTFLLCGLKDLLDQEEFKITEEAIKNLGENPESLMEQYEKSRNASGAGKTFIRMGTDKDKALPICRGAFLSLYKKKMSIKEIKEWTPGNKIADFIEILRQNGLLMAQGFFGELYYNSKPERSDKYLENKRTCFFFKKGSYKTGEQGVIQPIVVVGARAEEGVNLVYYINPADSSKPEVERSVYVMSYQLFCSKIASAHYHEDGYYFNSKGGIDHQGFGPFLLSAENAAQLQKKAEAMMNKFNTKPTTTGGY